VPILSALKELGEVPACLVADHCLSLCNFTQQSIDPELCQDISLLVRPSSATKPRVKNLEARGFPIVLSDLSEPVDELAAKLKGFDTIISAIPWTGLMSQIPLSMSPMLFSIQDPGNPGSNNS
jgi:hypothetical protein